MSLTELLKTVGSHVKHVGDRQDCGDFTNCTELENRVGTSCTTFKDKKKLKTIWQTTRLYKQYTNTAN